LLRIHHFWACKSTTTSSIKLTLITFHHRYIHSSWQILHIRRQRVSYLLERWSTILTPLQHISQQTIYTQRILVFNYIQPILKLIVVYASFTVIIDINTRRQQTQLNHRNSKWPYSCLIWITLLTRSYISDLLRSQEHILIFLSLKDGNRIDSSRKQFRIDNLR
jgi:hypothetical protein